MEDLDQLISDLMEDPDLLDRYSRNIPFTRKQNVVNMTHKVKNIKETTTTITIDFTHTHQRFWRSAAGDVTAIVDAPFPPIVVATFPNTVVRNVLDEKRAEGLWSTAERDSLVHNFLFYINIPHNNWTNLETQVSLCLFNLVSTAKDEGYNAIDVVLFIEGETVDTYDEEEVARAMRELASVANPVPRSSVEALPSQVLDDRISSDKCTSLFG